MPHDPPHQADGRDATDDAVSDPTGWLEAHGDALFRYARSRVGRIDLAEDLVQEALLAALQARRRFQGRSTVGTWLLSILRRKVVDHYREAASRAVLLDDAVAHFDNQGYWRDPPATWKTPPETLEAREFLGALDGCLGSLPPPLASAFLLREMEGMEPDEICRALDVSPGNLRVRLHRARLLLRACLESQWFDERPDTPKGPK